MLPAKRAKPSDEFEAGEFLLHASHDLRTALRAIRMHTDLLLKDHLAAQVPGLEERLGFIVDGALKVDLLANGISSYSVALQIRKESFQPAPLDVLLRTVLAKLGPELRALDATVTNDKLPRVCGAPDRLMEVFENLLMNALRHRGSLAPISKSLSKGGTKSGSLPFATTVQECKRRTWRAFSGHSCACPVTGGRVRAWVWRFAA